jgi:hypothetical protein
MDQVRLALHSTHEAAEKIAGIGAVLDGILPEPDYQAFFAKSLLAGVYHFPKSGGILAPENERNWRTSFDSAGAAKVNCVEPLSPETSGRLQNTAEEFGSRIVCGERRVGQDTWVPVLLASPSGLRREKVVQFTEQVTGRFNVDFEAYREYPAFVNSPDPFLKRILRCDPAIPIPPFQECTSLLGDDIYGGVPFAADRAVFPAIPALDSFEGFYKSNQYTVELEFYLFAAPAIWLAAKQLICDEWQLRPENITLFAHDWLGVPLFWALKIDPDFWRTGTVYFAHESRICRLIVEGVLRGRERTSLAAVCNPEGHDASFYKYLQQLDDAVDFDTAFPGCGGFEGIFYHVLNRQAEHFDRVVAVGGNVARETRLMLRGRRDDLPVSLCPNGIPDDNRSLGEIDAARRRLAEFCERNFGYEPTYVFTSVNRCELSKAPWRNVEFYRTFVERYGARCRSLFVWLSRPRPLPTEEDIERWAKWQWPKRHRSKSQGGDLRCEEEPLWEMIEDVNRTFADNHQILYVNQYGWGKTLLGDLDPVATEFKDLRTGTDVELGLSVYEPFGIAPLEPFSSGAVCVVSDACGCARHLQRLRHERQVSAECFVIGRFTQHDLPPANIDMQSFKRIEADCYNAMAAELYERLQAPRGDRLDLARQAMPNLSWQAAVQQHLIPNLR